MLGVMFWARMVGSKGPFWNSLDIPAKHWSSTVLMASKTMVTMFLGRNIFCT